MGIVERLRTEAPSYVLIGDAAVEIERLREEVVELKDLMQATVNYTGASVSSKSYTFHPTLGEGE